jgi:hypothetical protein
MTVSLGEQVHTINPYPRLGSASPEAARLDAILEPFDGQLLLDTCCSSASSEHNWCSVSRAVRPTRRA